MSESLFNKVADPGINNIFKSTFLYIFLFWINIYERLLLLSSLDNIFWDTAKSREKTLDIAIFVIWDWGRVSFFFVQFFVLSTFLSQVKLQVCSVFSLESSFQSKLLILIFLADFLRINVMFQLFMNFRNLLRVGQLYLWWSRKENISIEKSPFNAFILKKSWDAALFKVLHSKQQRYRKVVGRTISPYSNNF